ncbi:MAG: phospholipid carrier-dependent glycosyltransferase [Candidatus Omnitrophica bacterium]|nr:phospholipid carrier-dependent glycosyltransferase [Candidatus Omnitrophota bacterium]
MDKKNQRAFLIIAGFFAALFVFTGILFSGFHFKDDIGILTGEKALQNTSFPQFLRQAVSEDLSVRFRPLRMIERAVEIKLFGSNFPLWYGYNCLMGIFCAYFLYLFARTVKFSFSSALLFPAFTLLGQQSVIWGRSSLSEPIGMFFLSLSLLCMAKSVHSETDRSRYNGLFLLFFVLSALSKESFLLLLPALVFWKVWLFGSRNDLSFKESLAKNKILVLVTSLMMLAGLSVIFLIGPAKEPNSGICANSPMLRFIVSPIHSLRDMKFSVLFLSDYTAFLVILLGVFLMMEAHLRDEESLAIARIIRVARNYGGKLVVLFLLIIVPQFVIYSRTGLQNRFALPGFIAFAYALAYLHNRILVSRTIKTFAKTVFVAVIVLLLVPRVAHAFFRVKNIADEGVMTNRFLNTIIQDTQKDSVILVALDPVIDHEASGTLAAYLSLKGGRENVYYMLIPTGRALFDDDSRSSGLRADLKESYKNKSVESIPDKTKIDCIALFPSMETKFLELAAGWFDKSKFNSSAYGYFEGNFLVYSRKK